MGNLFELSLEWDSISGIYRADIDTCVVLFLHIKIDKIQWTANVGDLK